MRNGLVLCRGRAVQRKKISWQIARVPSGMANILLSPGTTVQAPYSQACYRALPGPKLDRDTPIQIDGDVAFLIGKCHPAKRSTVTVLASNGPPVPPRPLHLPTKRETQPSSPRNAAQLCLAKPSNISCDGPTDRMLCLWITGGGSPCST